MLIGKCGDCALRAQDGGHCGLTGFAISDESFCSSYQKELSYCDICHAPIIGGEIIDIKGSDVHILCNKCLNLMNTCVVCKNSTICDFESSSSPIPKMVSVKKQQGNATLITQVRNPERIKATCASGCACWNKEYGCGKQDNGYCVNYDYIHS